MYLPHLYDIGYKGTLFTLWYLNQGHVEQEISGDIDIYVKFEKFMGLLGHCPIIDCM